MGKIQVASQVFLWMSYVLSRKPIGERETFDEFINEVLSDIAWAGYQGVELDLDLTSTAEKAQRLKELLEKHSLKLASLFAGGVYHERDQAEHVLRQTVSYAHLAADIGCRFINVNPSDKHGEQKTEEELKVQAEYMNKVGRALRDMGITFMLHNHTSEIVNNAREFRSNMKLTDPDLVSVCLDTHWAYRGGVDLYGLLEEYVGRVKALHLRNSKNGVWMETLGDGDVNHYRISEMLRKANFSGWLIVELAYEEKTQVTRSVRENAKLSREYIRRIFGV